MRSCSTLLLASALAASAIAKPLEKRVMVTEWDLHVVTKTIYVTAGQPAPTVVSQEASQGEYQHPPKNSPQAPSATPKLPPKASFPAGQGYSVALPPSSSAPGYGSGPADSPKSSSPAPKPTTIQPPPPPPSQYVPPPPPSTSQYVPPPASTSQYVPPPASTSQYVPPPPSTTQPASPPPTPVFGVEHKSGEDQAYLCEGADYQDAVLWHHNRARANHNASNLQWSDECASAAANAAAFCDFEHHTVEGQGQNLFTVSGEAYNATAGITESWYKAEADIYGAFGGTPNMASFHEWGHLSQVLWKKTTHVGCVTIDCGSKMTIDGQPSELSRYTVCNYSPPGNYEGEYAENVLPAKASYEKFSWAD